MDRVEGGPLSTGQKGWGGRRGNPGETIGN